MDRVINVHYARAKVAPENIQEAFRNSDEIEIYSNHREKEVYTTKDTYEIRYREDDYRSYTVEVQKYNEPFSRLYTDFDIYKIYAISLIEEGIRK